MSPQPYRICLIEDDEIMGEALSDRFGLEGYACDWFKTGRAAMQGLHRKPYAIAICDIQLPDITGEELFVKLLGSDNALPPFVFITGFGKIDMAVSLLKLGAHDYLTKPLDIHALLDTVRRLCAKAPPPLIGDYRLGISGAMRAIESMLPRLAENAKSILITGESGVGKEAVARELHRVADPAANTPFVAVNCGALTESLLEAELFGYVKGAYTGAVRDKKGVFELADHGTLFLDEVGEMSPAMQVKLLRAIQERTILRVGAETPVRVSIRLVCATHQDLKKMVEEGRFREDLYYRIHVVHLHIPPLRERKEDIPWLARRLLEIWADDNADPRTLDRCAEKALFDYPWPGNIRQLKHCLERACILSASRTLSAAQLFGDTLPAVAEPAAAAGTLNDYLQSCEREYIEGCLRANGGRIADTAAELGISRKNLWEKMKKLKLQDKDERTPIDAATGVRQTP
ncbi:MAG: sigma-54 dependent transcriptional regulator [Rhodocyclaceae bacterium]|nr:sigma-54 dependent transcriptional regulator [Rhodocyclaceae bacterium]